MHILSCNITLSLFVCGVTLILSFQNNFIKSDNWIMQLKFLGTYRPLMIDTGPMLSPWNLLDVTKASRSSGIPTGPQTSRKSWRPTGATLMVCCYTTSLLTRVYGVIWWTGYFVFFNILYLMWIKLRWLVQSKVDCMRPAENVGLQVI